MRPYSEVMKRADPLNKNDTRPSDRAKLPMYYLTVISNSEIIRIVKRFGPHARVWNSRQPEQLSSKTVTGLCAGDARSSLVDRVTR